MVEKGGEKVIANPLIVLHEKSDNWALPFDPDTDKAFISKLFKKKAQYKPIGTAFFFCSSISPLNL